MPKDLLYEIGVEELPASYIQPALAQLARDVETFLKSARLTFGDIRADGTPRRLVLRVTRLLERQPDKSEEVQGPSAKAAFNAEGLPTPVAEGFARSRGVDLTVLKVKPTPKGDYVFAQVETAGRSTEVLLAEWLPQATRALNFPKSMRWGLGTPLKFARPIQWLCALYGDELLPFSLEHLSSGARTFGHRFLSPEPITPRDAAGFEELLAKHWVLLSQREREMSIFNGLKQQCQKAGMEIIEDSALVETCANQVEWPAVLLGGFDKGYLALPEEIIVCALREHQSAFAARGADRRLAPHFLVVTNGTRSNLDGVRQGNEAVVKARLEDARFFFQEDTREPLSARLEDLKHVVWLEGFGSVHEKSERLQKMAEWLAQRLAPEAKASASRAGLLAKCDLVSHVVGEKEYTSLQGTMGGLYATLSGEPKEVAAAISEQYRPRFSGDAIPVTRPGQILALADKLDDLLGCFAAKLIPTGSQDPYALRRKAAGAVAILLAQTHDVSLSEALNFGLQAMRAQGRQVDDPGQVSSGILEFIRQRMELALLEKGFAPDVMAAAVSKRYDLPREALMRAAALQELKKRDDFEPTAQAFSRVNNILGAFDTPQAVDVRLLSGGPEKNLYDRFLAVRPVVERLIQAGNYIQAFEELSRLRVSIDGYFDGVMVMDEDKLVRNNRLSFLHQIGSTLNLIGDFTKLAKK